MAVSIKKPMLIQSLITQSGGVIKSSTPVEGYVLSYNDRIPLEALDASVQLNIDGASSSASIRLATGTNVDGRAYVEMYTVQGSAGVFRTRSPQIGYGGQNTTLQLEHAINELGDFIITDKIEKEMTLKQAMQKIFEYYGKKSSMWSLGTVDSPNDPDTDDKAVKCVLSVDYDNCLDAIESVMEQYPFMMLTFNFSSFPWKLNVKNKPTLSEAQGRLSRNVKSATVTRDDSEMFNRVYAQKKDGKYGKIDAPDYWKKKYGLIETVISGANDTEAIWKQTVNSYLKTHKKPRYSITIDGIELSNITGETLDKLTLGKMMTLALPDYKTTVSEVITGVSFPSIYKQPNSCTVTLNAEEDKVIKYIKKAQKTAGKASRSAGAVSKAAFVDASVANNVLTLTKGDGSVITFSKAVTLKGSWADGKYTVRAYQNNINTTTKKVEENQVGLPISTVLNGIELQANKSPSVINTYDLSIPLKVMYNNSGYKGNTEYTQDVVVSAKAVWDKVKLTGKWSGNTYTATATNGESVSTYTYVSTPSWSDITDGKKATVSFYYFNSNNEQVEILPANINIKLTGSWNSNTYTATMKYGSNNLYSVSTNTFVSTPTWSDITDGKKATISFYYISGSNHVEILPANINVKLTGSWSSNTYTATMKHGGTNLYSVSTQTFVSTPTWSNITDGKKATVSFYYVSGNNHVEILPANISVKLTGAWSNNTYTATMKYGNTELYSVSTNTFVSSATWGTGSDVNKATVSFYYISGSNHVEILPATINAVSRYNAGHNEVVVGDIDLNGSSSSTSSSKPSTALNRTDPSKITGYKWLKKMDGTWKNLGSFSITTNATHLTVPLYYLANGTYTKCTKNKLYYYTE